MDPDLLSRIKQLWFVSFGNEESGAIASLKYRRFRGDSFRCLLEDLKKCPSIEEECEPDLVRHIWKIPAFMGAAINDIQDFQAISREEAIDLFMAIKREIDRILGKPRRDRL